MGRLAVVTGGANGIGQAIVRRLAADRYTVLFCDVDREGGPALAQELTAAGLDVHFTPADVSKVEDIANLAEVVRSLDGPVYAVVNNAGIFPRSPFLELSVEDWERVLATNLTGPFLVSRALLPSMLEGGEGVIINFSSRLGYHGDPSGAHYAASKHGVRGLTKSMALALGPRGIRVNAIAPGPTDTAQAWQAGPREELLARGRQLPLGRVAQPADIANVVAFLLGPDAAYVTGQTIPVNGGADMP
jgi:3-oxoacyl-[acyl-carrier protein] reductase